MRAPCDSDSERCNNIQYTLDDGGFYPKCLAVLRLHTYFRKRGPMGAKPLILTMAVPRRASNFTENADLGAESQREQVISHVWSLVFQSSRRENITSFVIAEESRAGRRG